ncbi:hypothetical protein LZ32DRAFT_602597 [Colletotrichum eremochloae]|nr:hypothetical protein LZ32DRAFT_602597 [Colletotrichum eremochloae]
MRFTSYATSAIALLQVVAAAPHGQPSVQLEKRWVEPICAVICAGACAGAPIACLACVAACLATAVPGEEVDVEQLKADIDGVVAEATDFVASAGLQQ